MRVQRVVLLGVLGHGKTTLFNKLTGSNEKTYNGGFSSTRQIVSASTKYGEGFEVVDAPGFDSEQDKLSHIAGILAALSYGNVNRLLVIVKWESITQCIGKNLETIIKPIKRFIELVTVIVTHMDNCEKEINNQGSIIEYIEKKFKTKSILFISKFDQAESICLQIEKILYENKNEKQVKLLESEIFKYFDFIEIDEMDVESKEYEEYEKLKEQEDKVQIQFSRYAQKYVKYIEKLQNRHPHFLDILQYITQKIKEDGQTCVIEFEKAHGDKIVNLADKFGNNISYLHYIFLKKQISKEIHNVTIKALEKMKQSQKRFFNFLRKCKYCGEVWLKVTGCENETTCGERVNQSLDDEQWDAFKEKLKIQLILNKDGEFEEQIEDSTPQPINQ